MDLSDLFNFFLALEDLQKLSSIAANFILYITHLVKRIISLIPENLVSCQ